MTDVKTGVQTVTVIGLERFPTRMWKNIGCDRPGCENWDKTEGNRYPGSARDAAVANGWQCDDEGDFCPEHRQDGLANQTVSG